MPYAIGDQKTCSTCRLVLPLDAFNKNRSFKDGLANQCRDCLTESRRKYREAHPELHQARHVKNRYGIALETYEAMVVATDGKCPVCGEVPGPPWNKFDVDHDHETGRVRGLLCRGCNLALGGARDNPAILRALADYLEAHHATPVVDQPPPVIPTRYAKGETHGMAMLNEAQVREIRALYAAGGTSQSQIAERYGITQAMVSNIVRRKSWAHLQDEE